MKLPTLRATMTAPSVRPTTTRDLFRVLNRATPDAATDYAEVYLYDEIGGWGITAGMFVDALSEADVDEIDLHINSPGGLVWDGIAMYNALVNHRAYVTVYVDGMAASAASIVMQAGDKRVMSQGAQVMIHDAWGQCVGNAAEMDKMSEVLNHESDNLAGLYAARSGGTASSWRKSMLAETWYTADEAVAVGLADELTKRKLPDEAAAAARWDLRVFGEAHGYRYPGGRADAPAPIFSPASPAHAEVAASVAEPSPPPPSAGTDPATRPDPTESTQVAPPPVDQSPPLAPVAAGQPFAPCTPAALGTALQAAAGVPDYQIDPGLFRAAISLAAETVEPIEAAPAVAPPPTAAEMARTFANAFKEAVR